MRGYRKGKPQVHPARIVLDGCINELLDLGKGHNFVKLAIDLGLLHAQDRAVQVDVLSTGQLGVKSSTDLEQRPTRPWIVADPSVGSVIRESSFSSVLLPAPLRPMIPTTSP